MESKTTFGLIVGTRGFFSPKLALEGRRQLIAKLDSLGYGYVILPEDATPTGAIETVEDARKCARLFQERRDDIHGIIVALPNFGDEVGIVNTLKMAKLDVPILVQASDDEIGKVDVNNRRDSFCGKLSVCNNLYQYDIPFTDTTYHTCAIESDVFTRDVEFFAGVCRVVNGLRNARIGAIGARPAAFQTMRFSEKLLQSSGITVVTVDLSEILAAAGKIGDSAPETKQKLEEIKREIQDFENDIEKFAAFEKSEVFKTVEQFYAAGNETTGEQIKAVDIIDDLKEKHYKLNDTLSEIRRIVNLFTGNFSENNIFKFKTKFDSDNEYVVFVSELKEFIEEDKISEFEKRVNERFANIVQLIARETNELVSKEAEIEKIIKKINNDFLNKNFVEAIKEMEIRTNDSTNPVVNILLQIKQFNDDNGLLIGKNNLFTDSDLGDKNRKAVELLKQLIKELEKHKKPVLTLSDSFDLQFRIVENDNNTGWVENLSNVGSEGTDILVKAMVNILLLNVFKESASRKFQDFKLHCVMDEIGRLHPVNVKGILRFANERNILLINGSPISQNATDYRYTYKLSKEKSAVNNKYITRVKRLIKLH